MKRKLVTTVLAATMFTGTMTGVVAYASTNQVPMAMEQGVSVQTASVTPFTLHESSEFAAYAKLFQVTQIAGYSNNGGKYSTSTLDKAFDGDLSTHWETGKPNSQTFTNEVVVVFNQMETINRIVYGARKDASNKGYATAFSIYGSMTEDGDDFTLITTGTAQKSAGLTQIQFEATECKRIKFVFDEAFNSWASAREFMFFKEDAALDEVNDVFTNGLMNELTTKYQSEAARGLLLEQFSNHPFKDDYQIILDTMTAIANGENISEDEITTMPQKGNESTERNRTQLTYALYAHEPAGVYIRPGDVLQVFVDADPSGKMPEIVFGSSYFKTLQPGYNEIKLPSTITSPQRIYFANRAYSTEQAYQPRIRVVGGHDYPVYIHGKTDPKAFYEELMAYDKTVTSETVSTGIGPVNFCDISSENILIQTSAKGAATGLTQQLNSKNKYVDYTIEVYEDMYREFVEYSGFDYDLVEGREWNHRPLGKFMVVGSHAGPFGWAQHGFTGYNGGDGMRNSGFWVSLTQASIIENGGWALFHEIAHQYDSATLGTGESTNNLYSLMMQDKYLATNRMVNDNRWEKHFTAYHNTKVYPNDLLFLGAITYQLEGIYGNHIYGEAQKLARQNTNNWITGMSNKQRIAVAISKAVGINVLPHYEYYGIEMNDRARSLVADLPVIDIKSYYANDKIFAEDAAAFTNADVKPVITASGSGTITLQMSIEEADNALLVYELYRDGEFLGVTYQDTFVDKTPTAGVEHVYTVKAYDRKFNVSLESDPVVKNASEPNLSVQPKVTVSLYSDFDPMQYATATDVNKADISGNIKVVENTVNTNVKGNYAVTYQVTDDDGNKSSASIHVEVTAAVTYAGTLTPSATSGYYKINKDHNNGVISLKGAKGEVSYTNGISAHANTTVIYTLEDGKYDTFEAFIGLDDAVRSRTQASVVFAVYADGTKVYDSGVMKASDEQKLVSIDLTGITELKLVTTDANDGNSYDHAMWADAKFIQSSAKPELSIPSDTAVKVGETMEDVYGSYAASDIEDGDLTGNVTVTGDVNFDKAGKYTITYSVTDSNGNTTVKTRTIAVVDLRDFTYVSDATWANATCGWGSIKKDLSPSSNTIRLTNADGTETTFAKGLGAHAYSSIKYDLTTIDAEYFSSFVGIDRAMYNSVGSVTFEVWLDGQKVVETPLMTGKMPMQYLEVNIAGAKELTLIVTTGNNGNGSDHAVWADAKFHFANADRIDLSSLEEAVNACKAMDLKDYTKESVELIKASLAKAEEILGQAGTKVASESESNGSGESATNGSSQTVTQEACDQAADQLTQAMNAAVISQGKISLGQMLIQAFDAKYDIYEGVDMWDDFVMARNVYKANYENETTHTELELRIMTGFTQQLLEMLEEYK